MNLELVFHPNEMLQTKITEEVNFDNPQYDLNELRDSMIKCMTDNLGIGLAANQCGLNIRCFAFLNGNATQDHESKVLACNPSWERVAESEDVDMFESCLSYPGIVLSVNRPHRIKATWTDHLGKTYNEILYGYAARVFMHECDHLEGKLFVDYLSSLKRSRITKKLRERAR